MATGHVLQSEVRRYIVSNVVAFLQKDNRVNLFDAIAARGASGLLIAAPVATALGKDLIIVRKPGEGKGDYEAGHGQVSASKIRWIGLDDWVSGGSTMTAILKILKDAKYKAPVAILLYGNQGPELVTKFNARSDMTYEQQRASTRDPLFSRSYTLGGADNIPEWLSEYDARTVIRLNNERK